MMPRILVNTSAGEHYLHYNVQGPENGPKVVLVMGLITEGAAWSLQAEHLQKEGYQVVSFDNRGIGHSTSPSERCTTRKMAEDALVMLDHLGWSRFHLVGISMGGMISQELALMAPHRVLSLTLMVTHAGGRTARATPRGLRLFIKGLFAKTDDERVENALNLLYGPATLANSEKRAFLTKYHLDRLSKRVKPSLSDVINQVMAVQTHFVGWPQLLQIRFSSIPILIMTGTHDLLVRPVNSFILHRALGGDLVEIPQAGHGLLAEYEHEVNISLSRHFERSNRERSGAPDSLSRREALYAKQYDALSYACAHRPPCIPRILLLGARSFFAGLFFRLLFNSYIPHIERSSSFQQAILFASALASARILYNSIACLYRGIRYRAAVRSLVAEQKSTLKLRDREIWPDIAVPHFPRGVLLFATLSAFVLIRNMRIILRSY